MGQDRHVTNFKYCYHVLFERQDNDQRKAKPGHMEVNKVLTFPHDGRQKEPHEVLLVGGRLAKASALSHSCS